MVQLGLGSIGALQRRLVKRPLAQWLLFFVGSVCVVMCVFRVKTRKYVVKKRHFFESIQNPTNPSNWTALPRVIILASRILTYIRSCFVSGPFSSLTQSVRRKFKGKTWPFPFSQTLVRKITFCVFVSLLIFSLISSPLNSENKEHGTERS